jgi:hypothetical protein
MAADFVCLERRGSTLILYCGLDVSLKQTAPCVVGGDGRVVREAKLATDPEVRSKVADPQQQ